MDAGTTPGLSVQQSTPWTFKAILTLEPNKIADKDIVSCAIYKSITEILTKQLFESERMLKNSLRGGLSVRFEELRLDHFDLEGRFDRAVCTLTLTHRGPARFLLETHFSLDGSLVTTATREGLLYFEELN
jgi:hypothetical protein